MYLLLSSPEPLTALELLANAAFLEATDVPKDIQSHLPSKTAPITTLLKTNTPALLPTTLILRPVHLYTFLLEPNWSIDELLKTPTTASYLDVHIGGKSQPVMDHWDTFYRFPIVFEPRLVAPIMGYELLVRGRGGCRPEGQVERSGKLVVTEGTRF